MPWKVRDCCRADPFFDFGFNNPSLEEETSSECPLVRLSVDI